MTCCGWQAVVIFVFMAAPLRASNPSKIVSCWKNWLKMTDFNYLKALERYQNCGELARDLSVDLKDDYKRSLLDNLYRSSNYFFDHTELSPADVIRVLRSASSLMEAWTGDQGSASENKSPFEDDLVRLRTDSPIERPGDCYDDEEDVSCTDEELKWLWWTKFMFYAYVALIVLQSVTLALLFFHICCTDLLTSFPSCQYETQCCCEEDKEWITKLINECENNLKHSQNDKSECYPLLLSSAPRKMKSTATVGYGTNIGKRGRKDEEILTDLTPLSSPRLGSDSEFEALMNRRPLKSLTKLRPSTIQVTK